MTAIIADIGGTTALEITIGEVDMTGVGTKVTGGTRGLTVPKSAFGGVDMIEILPTMVREIGRITCPNFIMRKADVTEVAPVIIEAALGRIAATSIPTKGTGGAQRITTTIPTKGARSAAVDGPTVHALEDHPDPELIAKFHRPKRSGGWRPCKQTQRGWRMIGARGWLQLMNGRRSGVWKTTGLDRTGLASLHRCTQ